MSTLVAGLGLASGASGVSLFTNGTHTTPVAVGSPGTMTATVPFTYTSATSVLNNCSNSSLSLVLTTNFGGTVAGNFTSGTFTGCAPLPWSGVFSTPWTLTVSGAPTTSGGVTAWAAQITNVRLMAGGGTYSGNLTTGVTAQQTGAGGHMCLNLADAGQLAGPLSSNFRIDTNYCFDGSASTWSLTQRRRADGR
jgi:hypothetical protein